MSRERRSAKDIITNYANELLNRTNDPHVIHKIHTVEVIAMRMGWNELYNRLRFRERKGVSAPQAQDAIETDETAEPWWQR